LTSRYGGAQARGRLYQFIVNRPIALNYVELLDRTDESVKAAAIIAFGAVKTQIFV
jgi:hypothetical protein